MAESSDPDLALARKAVNAGFVREHQVRTCLRELELEFAAGRPRRFLGKVMVERGLISFLQLVELLKYEERPVRAPDAASGEPGPGPAPVPAPTIPRESAAPDPGPTLVLTDAALQPTRRDSPLPPPAPVAAPPLEPTLRLTPEELAPRPTAVPSTGTVAPPTQAPLAPTLILPPEAPPPKPVDPAYRVATLYLSPPEAAPATAAAPPPADVPPIPPAAPIEAPAPAVPAETAEDQSVQPQTLLLRFGPAVSSRAPAAPAPPAAPAYPDDAPTLVQRPSADPVTEAPPSPAYPDDAPTLVQRPSGAAADSQPPPTAPAAPSPAYPDDAPTLVKGPAAVPIPSTIPVTSPPAPLRAPTAPVPPTPVPPPLRTGPPPTARPATVRTAAARSPGTASSSGFKVLFSRKQGAAPGPSTFGRYQLISEIARGAMGIVYRAFDPELKRTIALKVMLPGDGPVDEAKVRFQREALLSARLHHPNIVQVYDVGEVEGKLFYTMQLVDGSSLQQVLNSMGQLPQLVALTILRDAARALHHAHEHKLVHRDIKPANLLLTTVADPTSHGKSSETTVTIKGVRTSSFRVLVTDFGIAKDVNSQTMFTRAGTVLGTPAYMSPEQARGDQEKLAPVSDVYSLGVLLYQLLCGQTPFSDPDPVKVLADILQKEPPALRKIAPDLPRDLELIVMKAMERDPRRRYETAAMLADDIDRFLVGEAILARGHSPVYRLGRWAARHRTAAAITAAILVVSSIAGFERTLWPHLRKLRETQIAEAARSARRQRSREHLDRARALMSAGQFDAAADAARAMLAEMNDEVRDDEDLGIAAAHGILAQVHDRRGEVQEALQERFRGLRTALGRDGEDQARLDLASALVDLGRPRECALLLDGLPRRARTDEHRADAAYWIGRALEGQGEFARAAAWLLRAGEAPALTDTLREPAAAHAAFCRSLAGRTRASLHSTAPVLVTVPATAGSGNQLVGADGGRLFVAHWRDGAIIRDSILDLDAGAASVTGLARLDFPDRSRPLLVAAAENRIWLVDANGASLEPLADLAVEGNVRSAVAADIDGDGRREIILGGRVLSVLAWHESERRADVLRTIDPGGEVSALEAFDLDADGRAELLAFVDGGAESGMEVVRLDPRTPAFLRRVPLGRTGRPAVLKGGSAPVLAVATSWTAGEMFFRRLAQERAPHTDAGVPVGIHRIDLRSDGSCGRRPWVAPEVRAGEASVLRVHGRAGDFLWCRLQDADAADDSDRVLTVLRSEDGSVFARLSGAVAASLPGRASAWCAIDLDGDGRDEIAWQSGEQWTFLTDGVPAGGLPSTEPTSGDRPPLEDLLLEFGEAAERSGLPAEALQAFREASVRAAASTGRQRAVLGELRALARLGRGAALVARAEESAGSSPSLAEEVLRAGIEQLTSVRLYADAARLGARLEQLPLEDAQREQVVRQSAELRGRADPPVQCRFAGVGAVESEWRASAPVVARRREDGSWTIYGHGADEDWVAVRCDPRGPWRLRGNVRVIRQDPGVSVHIGTAVAAGWSSEESGEWHRYALDLEQGERRRGVAEQPLPWADPVTFELAVECAGAAVLRVPVRTGAGVPAEAVSAGSSPSGPESVGIRVGGRGAHDARTVVQIEQLDWLAASSDAQFVPEPPVSAAEHAEAAAGNWIAGRLARARELYQRAVTLGDLERARELGAQAAGVPSAWDTLASDAPARWTWLDARWWMALLRAATGDARGAQEGLQDAWRLAPDRVRVLLSRYALPLLERPDEGSAVRVFWASLLSAQPDPNERTWVEETLRELGPEATALLVPGASFEIVTRVRIAALAPNGTGARVGLRRQDIVEAVADVPVTSPDELAEALAGAARTGRDPVSLSILRDGRVQRIAVPPQDLGVDLVSIRVRRLRGP